MVIARFQLPLWIDIPKCIPLARRNTTLMWLCRLAKPTAQDTFVHGQTCSSHHSFTTSRGHSRSMLSSVPMLTMDLEVLVLAYKRKR